MSTYTDLTQRDVSFQLARTNPKLTSNVKLTVDSEGSLWLNSIDANEQLADQKYKRFAVSENSNHEVNIYRFYDYGKTPKAVSFEVGSTVGKLASAKDLKDQYDFGFYTSGAKYLNTRQYTEQFSYFAPLYLDSIVPTKFVIFKIPGPSNYTAGQGHDNFANQTVSSFATDLFKNASIVKVFDLSQDSKIGKYIHGIITNPMFNRDPLYVNYKSGGYSLYRGASITSGAYVEIPERLDTLFSQSLPMLKVEQYITEGYERNGIVHPRILNLEFLFNDTTAQPYEFNRYIGFYCNEIDLQNVQLDLDIMYQNSIGLTPENDQVLPKNYQQADDISFNVSNANGVTLRATGVSQDLSDLRVNRTSADTLFFPYLRTKDNNIHLIKSLSWNQYVNRAEFKLDDTTFDIGTAFGPVGLVTQENVTVSTKETRSTVRFEILTNPQHLDTLRIYHPNGARFDVNGQYDDLIFTRGYFPIDTAYSIGYFTGGSNIYINGDITPDLIAKAVADVIVRLKHSSIIGTAMKTSIFIQARLFGDTYGTLKIQSFEAVSGTPKFLINSKHTADLVYADGGFTNIAHPLIPAGNADKLNSQLSDVVVRTTTGWSTISRVYPSSDSISYQLTDSQIANAISDYQNFEVLMLGNNEVPQSNYNKIEIRSLYKPAIGVLSLFEVKDFDFSTYSSTYNRNLLLDLYKDFYIPAGVNIIDFTKYTYKVVGTGTISINNTQYSNIDSFIWQSNTDLNQYTVLNGDPILIKNQLMPDLFSSRLDLSYYDSSLDAVNYIGPFSLKAYHSSPDPNSQTYQYRDKFLYGNVSSEYQVYLENYITDFATEGRVTPYINKWGILDSTDCRDNPYRLNADILFGSDNFGPSHDEQIPTPEKLTHEWFYIESNFEYSLDPSLLKKNFSYFDKALSISDLTSSATYFEEYFTYLPTVNGVEVDRPQFRYSTLYSNEFTGQYETVFKGAKFIFSELDGNGKVVGKTTRFDGYKFSVLLKPIKEEISEIRQPVKYRVIENTDSKSITVVIELAVGHKDQIPKNLLIKGWSSYGTSGTAGTSGTSGFSDVIDQSTLFTDFFIGDPVEYNIDNTIICASLYQYNGMISGTVPILSGAVGQTILVSYTDTFTGITKNSVISTTGSQMFADVSAGQISNGDAINTTLSAGVYPLETVLFADGTHISVRLETVSLTGVLSNPFSIRHNIPYFDAMLGDYRISFNSDGVSDLTHSFLYYSKNKKYNNNEAYSTIKLSRGVDLSVAGVFPGYRAINTIRLTGLENYDSFANSEMNSFISGFAPLYIISQGSKQILVQANTSLFTATATDLSSSAIVGSGISGATQTSVTLNPNLTSNFELVAAPPIQTNPITTVFLPAPYKPFAYWTNAGVTFYNVNPVPYSTTFTWKNSIAQLQIFGGAKYHEKLFENVSFAKFAQLLSRSQQIVSFESYTGGVQSFTTKITMSTESPEVIQKTSMLNIESVNITENNIKGVAGFSLTEVPTSPYSISRYSGEYETIFKTLTGFKFKFAVNGNDLTGANCCLSTSVDNFCIIPDFEYVKYSKLTILDLENSQQYSSVYPYIGESAIDKTNYNLLASSWDYAYHFEYSDKKTKKAIAGSRRVTEDYSFVSKLLNLPMAFTIENFISSDVSNTDYTASNFGANDIIYSTFNSEVRFKLNLTTLITKFLSDNGLRATFQNFFKYSSGANIVSDSDLLGDLSFEDYLLQYCSANLVSLYQIGTFDFYELDDRTIQNNAVVFNSVSYNLLSSLGYQPTKAIKINNTKSNIIEGSITIKPSTGIKLVPKLKMQFI